MQFTFTNMEAILTVRELSKKLKVSEKTLYKWVAGSKIPYYKLNGCVRFNEQIIEAWLKKREVKGKWT